jgi:hypothetical protein
VQAAVPVEQPLAVEPNLAESQELAIEIDLDEDDDFTVDIPEVERHEEAPVPEAAPPVVAAAPPVSETPAAPPAAAQNDLQAAEDELDDFLQRLGVDEDEPADSAAPGNGSVPAEAPAAQPEASADDDLELVDSLFDDIQI